MFAISNGEVQIAVVHEIMERIENYIIAKRKLSILAPKTEKRRRELRQIYKFSTAMAQLLAKVHENGVIHNMPVLSAFVISPSDGIVRLSYWSRSTVAPNCYLCQVSTVYNAPECTETGEGSFKADVYSFGIALWQLVLVVTTGERPNTGFLELPIEMRFATNNAFPPSMDTIIKMCLQQNPADRPDMSMVLAQLQALEQTFEEALKLNFMH